MVYPPVPWANPGTPACLVGNVNGYAGCMLLPGRQTKYYIFLIILLLNEAQEKPFARGQCALNEREGRRGGWLW